MTRITGLGANPARGGRLLQGERFGVLDTGRPAAFSREGARIREGVRKARSGTDEHDRLRRPGWRTNTC